jgi:hypothetical protein
VPTGVGALPTLVFVAAACIWVYAVVLAVRVVQAVRPGERLSLFFPGWPWNVEKAVARYGPQVAAPLRAFQRAFVMFFGLVILVAAVAVFVAAQSR